MTYDLQAMNKTLRKYIDKDRFVHTQGVRYTACALAMAHGEDLEKAEVAGLLHDCAKCISDSKKLKICSKNGIETSEAERDNPFLLHAKVGAWIAKEKYHVDDPGILAAIRSHTTGRAGMSRLEQIVFIADYIEPRRNKSSRLPEIRETAFQDLDLCCYLILQDMLMYLHSRSAQIDPHSAEAFHYYEKLIQTASV